MVSEGDCVLLNSTCWDGGVGVRCSRYSTGDVVASDDPMDGDSDGERCWLSHTLLPLSVPASEAVLPGECCRRECERGDSDFWPDIGNVPHTEFVDGISPPVQVEYRLLILSPILVPFASSQDLSHVLGMSCVDQI